MWTLPYVKIVNEKNENMKQQIQIIYLKYKIYEYKAVCRINKILKSHL